MTDPVTVTVRPPQRGWHAPGTDTDQLVQVDLTTGPCARCHRPCCRYGRWGAPLCHDCRDEKETRSP